MGNKLHTHRALQALDKAHASIPTPANVVLHCRDQGRSPRRSTTPRPEQSCNVHIGCCGRDPEASGLQPHVMRRCEVTTDTCTHGASDSYKHADTGASGCPATRPFHDGNRCAASGFCAWGIQAAAGERDGAIRPGACTPHSLRCCFGPRRSVLSPETDLMKLIVPPLQTQDGNGRAAKPCRRQWRLL